MIVSEKTDTVHHDIKHLCWSALGQDAETQDVEMLHTDLHWDRASEDNCFGGRNRNLKYTFHHLAIAKVLYSTGILPLPYILIFPSKCKYTASSTAIHFMWRDKHQCGVLFPKQEVSPFRQWQTLTPETVGKQKCNKSVLVYFNAQDLISETIACRPDTDFINQVTANRNSRRLKDKYHPPLPWQYNQKVLNVSNIVCLPTWSW